MLCQNLTFSIVQSWQSATQPDPGLINTATVPLLQCSVSLLVLAAVLVLMWAG